MARTHVLTLNREFADHSLVADVATQSCAETLVNEIVRINRGARVIIDKIIIDSPTWIHKGRRNGFVISSSNGAMSLRLRFTGDGSVSISLRGQSVKEKYKDRTPIFIDYTGFFINGRAILDHVESTDHDTPYRYKQKVTDGDVLRLEITWTHRP